MTSAANSAIRVQQRHSTASALRAAARSPRFYVFLTCTLVMVLVCLLLGKDTRWDTVDYHFYAGFSAIHDRFARDYFAAGGQSYFNPYVYVPFYLLVKSGMPALAIATLLAVAQSGILWLTYELAMALAPVERPRAHLPIAIFAVALALANPILINQIGTSYTDCLTAEAVLAGWLLLLGAVRAPSAPRAICAGLMLGMVCALKLTNSVHALAAGVLLLFVPSSWRVRGSHICLFGLALATGFAVVAAPWAVRLQEHFGNPFFPLFNNLFHSPQYTVAPLRDYRFVPDSLADALRRPFETVLPLRNVDDEFAAPDLRYAVLCLLGVALLGRWAYLRIRRGGAQAGLRYDAPSRRAVTAVGCAFVVDWILWLTASGNGRYFIAMACVAAVIATWLVFFLFAARPKICAYLLVAILGAQLYQLYAGATYRTYVPLSDAPWFQVSLPASLARTPALYFAFGMESNSFIVPYLPAESGFVNLEGDYVLGAAGANGAHVESLIHRYSPNLRVIALAGHFHDTELPGLSHIDDTLTHFGLRVDTHDCATIVVRDMDGSKLHVLPATLPIYVPQLQGKKIEIPVSPDYHLITCRAIVDPATHADLADGERAANLVFARLEDACPTIFQPAGVVTEDFGDPHHGFYWVRNYTSTGMETVIVHGSVELVDAVRGGWAIHLGRETAWERAPMRLVCGRSHDRYYARVLSSKR